MPEILFPGRAKEEFLTEAVRQWKEAFPAEWKDMVKLVKLNSAALKNPNGMGDEGSVMNQGYLPSKLYYFLRFTCKKRLNEPNFLENESNFRLVWKICEDFVTKKEPTPFFDFGRTSTCKESASRSSPRTAPLSSESASAP